MAEFGYCATKNEKYYGFEGHLLISSTGVITRFFLSPADGNVREALWDLIPDNGYLSVSLQSNLKRLGLYLPKPYRRNMKDSCNLKYVRLPKQQDDRLKRSLDN